MGKLWTQEEIDYLNENAGFINLNTIAKNLNRPLNGVIIKMRRLKMGTTLNRAGFFTLGELARILHVERQTLRHWTEYHQLPVIKKKTAITRVFHLIDQEDFWDWAFEHQERIDFSKLEVNAIPPEPEWVDSLRNKNRKIKGNYYRAWTTKEERLLLELRSKGETYKAIGKILNRTSISAEKKYQRLLKNEITA